MRILFFLFILCLSCQHQTTISQQHDNAQALLQEYISFCQNTFSSITLKDTFTNKLMISKDSTFRSASFHPLFIGDTGDFINLNYNTGKIEQQTDDWNKYRHHSPDDLILFVDTVKIIGSAGILFPPSSFVNSLPKDNRSHQRSYPLFIQNMSTDTLQIGYGIHLPIIIEALDSSKVWRPIQKHYIYGCGTGLMHLFLPPCQVLLTSCPIYSGEYCTTLRLAFGFEQTTYSNQFVGNINYNQFAPK